MYWDKLCITEKVKLQLNGVKRKHINTGWAKKRTIFYSVYDEVGRRSIYQNVELFIRNKTNIRNVAIFKYSWHKLGETRLRRKYPLI